MKKAIIVISILTYFFSSKVLSQNNEKNQVDEFNKISKDFYKTDYDSSKFYALKALILSEQINYTAGWLKALLSMGESYLKMGLTDSAKFYYDNVIKFSVKHNKFRLYSFFAYAGLGEIQYNNGYYETALDYYTKSEKMLPKQEKEKYFAFLLNSRARSFKRMGELDKAQRLFVEALKYADINNDDNLQSTILINLGIINRNIRQFDIALNYYHKALMLFENNNDTIGIGDTYQNMASVYFDKNNNSKSLEYNLFAKKIFDKVDSENINYATLINNIGLNYLNLHRYDSAASFYKQAINISEKIRDTYGVADTKINLAEVLYIKNKINEARKIIYKAIDESRKIDAIDIEIHAFNILVERESVIGNFKEAFFAQSKLRVLYDSLMDIERINGINELQTKYETKEKEQKITLLQKENELKQSEVKQKAQQRNWLTGFFIVMLIVTVIIYFYYKKTKTAKNKIETLQREIHHRVKNNLAINRRMIEVAEEKTNDKESRRILQQLEMRITSMAEIHEQLYRKKDITTVDFKKYLNDINEKIASAFEMDKPEINQNFSGDIEIGFDKAVPLGLIVNELLTNAYKYAKDGSTLPKITIDVSKDSGKIKLRVSDNGKGFPEEFDINKIKSYGLKLVNGLTRQLNGTIEFFNMKGANVEIVVPF